VRKRGLKLLAPVCALVAMGAVAAVAQDGDGSSGSPSGDVAQVVTVESAARSAASVLARDRATGDALPADAAETFGEEARFGMNPSLSRRAIGGLSNSVYLVPANGRVCGALTFGERASVSCPETADLAAGNVGATTVTLEGGAIAIYGIVPDSVDEVVVDTGDPGSGATDVVDNAFLAVVPEGTELRTVSYTGPSGPVSFPIYDPAAP
jgi:hypothetical protein